MLGKRTKASCLESIFTRFNAVDLPRSYRYCKLASKAQLFGENSKSTAL